MPTTLPDLVCFSHLPWDHVFQRPHHLMTRAARDRRVLYVEEPAVARRPGVTVRTVDGGIRVARPQLPLYESDQERWAVLAGLTADLLRREGVLAPVAWYYTPLALPWSDGLDASAVVYDCMDELSAFAKASPELPRWERTLFARADVVFTGGRSLYEAKRGLNPNVHAFPSAVDVAHFGAARNNLPDPEDQATIPHPRLGWFGVIDERMDIALLGAVAARRPDWSIVLVGPVAKIDPRTLPRRRNVHRLGPKPYAALPAYLGGWDVAIMPFARNAATAFISPTKTPEYLAGGRPVVSTAIADVVRPYGERGLVRIADDPDHFVAACEAAMAEPAAERLAAVDPFLAGMSWDRTWARMDALIGAAVARRALAYRSAAGRPDAIAPLPADGPAPGGVAAAAPPARTRRASAPRSAAPVPARTTTLPVSAVTSRSSSATPTPTPARAARGDVR